MNTIIGDGQMLVGGRSRPFYIGTRQTAIFCELQGPGFDLPDYLQLLNEVAINQARAATAKANGEPYTPEGRKALTPKETAQFLYSALYAGAKREGLPVDFDVDTVSDFIDEAERSEDTADAQELFKPFETHYGLLMQRMERLSARPGNAPAPALVANRGGKAVAKKPKASRPPGQKP